MSIVSQATGLKLATTDMAVGHDNIYFHGSRCHLSSQNYTGEHNLHALKVRCILTIEYLYRWLNVEEGMNIYKGGYRLKRDK